jgi:hypothetical protein
MFGVAIAFKASGQVASDTACSALPVGPAEGGCQDARYAALCAAMQAAAGPVTRFGVGGVPMREPDQGGCLPSDWVCENDGECCSGFCTYQDNPESGGPNTCW